MSVLTMPRQTKRNDLSIRIDAEVYRMAKILSAIEDAESIAEYISETLRPTFVERMKRHSIPIHSKKKPE